ncbi:MAG: cyclopropane-fatty-acyl-phospholipid synthase family protein [Burkholderiales bacterium]|jgi:cyclopropane-fatty-acyl-phospholipid synthase|nr:cyclopropane-fatty-acyl-phospholipid synthase family protein [Burkholderiales bacterium]MDP4969968.1 cyclopropane-fatty-acyl-phospholipid synthase family protein [Burkholderiaceae bacterium]
MSSKEERLSSASAKMPLMGRLLVNLLGRISFGSLKLIDPAGVEMMLGQNASDPTGLVPHAELRICDWQAAGLILRQGDVGFAESLRRGWVDSPDMVALFTLAIRNEQISEAVDGHWWALLFKRLSHWILKDNSRAGSRRNILSHYDVGNSFYRLWLDPSMTYSSGLFQGDLSQELEQAQDAKYDRILDQIQAQSGQTILEVGCGWGGFAERAARRGLDVVGITLSDAQLEWATARMQDEGLTDRVRLRLQDYRDVPEQFDHIVSIEMFEAVGLLHWPSYFQMLSRCLKPGGRVVVQTIDIAEDRFDAYRRGTDFIQQYIFPGGMLPSPSRFKKECESAGLRVLDVLSFGQDYAETMKRWTQRFDASIAHIRGLGYDEAFIRIWKMYLAYCEVGFQQARTDVKQWTLCANS